MRVIAHRGCPDLYPENTVAAFRNASGRCDWVEFDVRRCGSGEPIVFHDETLDRLLGVDARVDETSLAQIRALRVDDSDERVPTLPEAFISVPSDATVNVELKTTGLVDAVAETADAVDNETVVSSFSAAALREMAASDLPLAPIVADADGWADTLTLAAELGAEYVHPHYDVVLMDPERVAQAHDRGLEVNAWTLRSADPFDRLREVGVDGVFVDHPEYGGR
ncbi:glycerophosphodiester phosphodiesterase [Halobaculum limi]|uniref:glycerophosphodiester phosphodiesterase n=1 Tax=Halobaculum limi TaxID=3031916 RepID=UPI00240615AC|nr:glycerophosphodiester phosphodiesterase [Halobaculum sp. YSMS11]